ncbi:MAG: hypothetical protein AB7N91_22615 [Candidatus Tectimicrobiota bacterium]
MTRLSHCRLLPVLGLLVALVALGPRLARGVGPAWAGTVTGNAVTVSGLDNLAKTVDTYSKGNLGKAMGIGLGLAGMGIIAAGRLGLGAMAALAGVGAAFVPNMIGTAFDATQAMPLVTPPPVVAGPSAWWTPALGLLYPVLLAVRLAIDPVVLAGLALARGLRACTRRLAHA